MDLRQKVHKILIMFVAVLIAISMVQYTATKKDIQNNIDNLKQTNSEISYKYDYALIGGAINVNQALNDEMANDIQLRVMGSFNTKSELKQQFEERYGKQLLNIIYRTLIISHKSLENRADVTSYIADRDGIIVSESNKHETDILFNGEVTAYEEYANNFSNPERVIEVFDTLINGNVDFVAYSLDSDKPIITDLGELVSIFEKEGKDSLKGYQLVLKSEITEQGDLLGNSNLDENYKFFVINSFEMEDVLHNMQNALKEPSNKIEIEIERYEKVKKDNTETLFLNLLTGSMVFVYIAVSYSKKYE